MVYAESYSLSTTGLSFPIVLFSNNNSIFINFILGCIKMLYMTKIKGYTHI